jgi:hypothetical protein
LPIADSIALVIERVEPAGNLSAGPASQAEGRGFETVVRFAAPGSR